LFYSIPIGTDKLRLGVIVSFISAIIRNSYLIAIDGTLSGWPFLFGIYVGGKFDGKFNPHIVFIWFSFICLLISLITIVNISFSYFIPFNKTICINFVVNK
jgi:hypothetical protein